MVYQAASGADHEEKGPGSLTSGLTERTGRAGLCSETTYTGQMTLGAVGGDPLTLRERLLILLVCCHMPTPQARKVLGPNFKTDLTSLVRRMGHLQL
ncbi:hypothetical protein NDU88_000256 [Pleurodeles waltl]|uniref:Uncharacterized protein n=1 Tax=Pleurodeles waltl TaxID=8319 RepID=A0AAV7KP14_PLEWA|nr:hypothetical protein NDU88_000256 [Pleurodeles waltl]